MGDPMKIASLSESLGKTLMRGKFDMFEMRQLATTGFNPLQELSRKTGESMKSLSDKMSDGRFTIDMYRKAMEAATSPGGRFFEMQKKISETPYGKQQIMMTNIEAQKRELGEALLPVMGRLYDAIKPMVDGLPRLFDELRPGMERMVDGFREVLPNLKEMGGALFAMIKPIGSLFVSKPFVDLVKNVADVASSMMNILSPAVKGLAGIMEGIMTSGNWLIERIKGESKSLYDSYYYNYQYKNDKFNDEHFVIHPEKVKTAMAQLEKLYLNAYNPVRILPQLPKSMTNVDKKRQAEYDKMFADANSGLGDVSDSIVGSGRKQIIINVRSFAERFEVHAGNLIDAAKQSKEVFMRMFLEVLQSADAAM